MLRELGHVQRPKTSVIILYLFLLDMISRIRASLQVAEASTKLSSPYDNVQRRRMITRYDRTVDTSIEVTGRLLAVEVGSVMIVVGVPWKKTLIGLGLRLNGQRSLFVRSLSAIQMKTLECGRVFGCHGIHGR